MFGYPEIITYLLLIPVLLQIVLPLAMLIIWLIFNIPNFIVSKAVQEESTAESDERRRYPRIAGELIGAVIADKAGNVIGKVRNISTSGICVEDYPNDTEKIRGEITLRAGDNSNFRLLIQPRWESAQESGRTFGASILNHPVGWPIFASTS